MPQLARVFDPKRQSAVFRAVDNYLLATTEPLVICRHEDQEGVVMTKPAAIIRHQQALAESESEQPPYECVVCGFCTEEA